MRALVAAIVCACAVASTAQTRDGVVERPLVRRERSDARDVAAGFGHALQVATGPQGNVRVTAWRDRSIRVETRLEWFAPSEADLDRLGAVIGAYYEPEPTRLDVVTKGTHDKSWMKGVKDFPKALLAMPWRMDYAVRVPEYTSLTILVGEGETVVEGVNGIVSIASAKGPVRLANVSGSTRVEAAGGDVEISTSERSWRGGNLSASASGTLVLRVPPGFSAALDATAPGGVTIGGAALGPEFHGVIGTGGGGLTLVAGSRIEIVQK